MMMWMSQVLDPFANSSLHLRPTPRSTSAKMEVLKLLAEYPRLTIRQLAYLRFGKVGENEERGIRATLDRIPEGWIYKFKWADELSTGPRMWVVGLSVTGVEKARTYGISTDATKPLTGRS